MSRRERKPIDYMEALRKLKNAGLSASTQINTPRGDVEHLPALSDRVDQLLGIVNRRKRPASNMLFFVMYDIESNKVRYYIVKYLIAKGCTRVQKSIFLADLPADMYERIKSDMAEVQSLYENHDSIIVCPVSVDMLYCMKVIGKSINMDIILHNKNTLFF